MNHLRTKSLQGVLNLFYDMALTLSHLLKFYGLTLGISYA